MHFIEHLNFKTLKYDLTNKFLYKNTKKIPQIKKITLNFGCKTREIRQLSASLLALELITSKKGTLTTTTKPNIILKIRKGNPVGCKITLHKKQIFTFLEKIYIYIFSNIKNFAGIKLSKKINSKSLSFKIFDTFKFIEFEEHYSLFNNLPNLDITISTNSITKEELIFIIKSLQFPLKLKNIKANITQLVECNLAKIKVKSSNLFICFYWISGRVV